MEGTLNDPGFLIYILFLLAIMPEIQERLLNFLAGILGHKPFSEPDNVGGGGSGGVASQHR